MLQPITNDTWVEKYRYGDEVDIEATFKRIVDCIYAKDSDVTAKADALEALRTRTIIPAGRIQAGAGTDKRVTLINCFVSDIIQDSMDTEPNQPGLGIMDALKDTAITLQMGGGDGMNYSTVRPRGAIVKRTASVSSGVLPFMDMWNNMSGTVMSAGHRRGAMMGTLAIWHPDIEEFITAKQKKGRLTNFNISVLVTDAFMEALEQDKDWDLHFTIPRADGNHVAVYHQGKDHIPCYVYKRLKARALWDMIIENTYIHAEPGIIFIDTINNCNNLHYCEDIQCVNPCAEQALPPNGDCNLGHVNLAVMVRGPFSSSPKFDYEALTKAAAILVRFLDNVLDETLFPTKAQKQEAIAKRRTGIGYTGLANALQQLRVAYGSATAIQLTRKITRHLRDAVYRASIELAKERGPFPAFDADKYCQGKFIQTLSQGMQEDIRANGIRNAVLMSIAPTGTISLLAGNVSSGIEPVFLHNYERKVLGSDGTHKTYEVYDYGYLQYHEVISPHSAIGSIELPDYFVTTKDLTVDQHLEMQAAAQVFIDSAISKTINCPTEMSFYEFKDVYLKAYKLGLKGCTTYRPDPRSERGEVLSEKKVAIPTPLAKIPMQEVLEGRRYRVKWPLNDTAYYVIIDDYVDHANVRRPFEIFITSKSSEHEEWMKALSLLITAIFRREGDPTFIIEELKQVCSARGGAWQNQKYVNSLVAAIGFKIEEHFRWLGLLVDENEIVGKLEVSGAITLTNVKMGVGKVCSSCQAPAVIKQSGCNVCLNCGDTKCG